MYILGEIKQVDDIYSLEEVNCLEKPLGIMLNSFNSLYLNKKTLASFLMLRS